MDLKMINVKIKIIINKIVNVEVKVVKVL
jgi:hypothetical protein